MTLLKRTNDLVFKKLFVMSKSGLKGMLSAVLGEEVRDISVLNPEIPGDFVGEGGDKIIVLDVRVELLDGRRVIVEMQMLVSDVELPPRLVFYAARDLSTALSRGQGYGELTPTVLIVWLGERLFRSNPQHLHRIFELRERDTGELLSDHLAVHVLQLQDFEGPSDTPEDQALTRWARFFLAKDEAELDRLAEGDEQMEDAVETIKQLSQDREAVRLAQEREDEVRLYHSAMARATRKGKAELVAGLLETKFGILDARTAERVRGASESELETWALRVLSASTLADVFGA